MNQNKNHTPLTAEELVKLLDTKSDKDAYFKELDDFEKEAFDGFNTHTSSKEAKELIDSIQLEISKKVVQNTFTNSTKDSASKKNKIIWFAAAASLVLILTLSIFLIIKSTSISNQSLAINDPIIHQEQAKAIPDSSIIINSENIIQKISEESKNDNEEIGVNKNKFKTGQYALVAKQGASSYSNNTGAPSVIANNSAIEPSIQNNITSEGEISSVNSLTSDKNNTENKTQTDLLNPIINSEKFTNDAEEISDSIISKNKFAESNNDVKHKAYSKEETTKIEASLFKKAEVEILDGDQSNANSRAPKTNSPTKMAQNFKANYTGGELAIKEYIMDYYKKINSTQKLQGSFKITAKVLVNGTLVTISITNISKGFSDCEDFLKEALNKMNEWNPAIKNGAIIDSETQFTLMF